MQSYSETQITIEQLKHRLDEAIFERDQGLKNIATANKKVMIEFLLKMNKNIFLLRLKTSKMIYLD
jgi:hypothetical protein